MEKPIRIIHSTYGRIRIYPDRAEKIIEEDSFFSAVREIHANTILSHDNVINFRKIAIGRGVKSHSPRFFIEMPKYYSDLHDLIMNPRVTIEPIQIYKIAADILAATQCIHANGIIHCDIKAKNILVQLNPPKAVMIDFGICSVEEKYRESLVQTITYRAPEVNTLHALTHFTSAIDIWSIGCVLMELILRRNLFTNIFSDNSVIYAEHLYAGITEVPQPPPTESSSQEKSHDGFPLDVDLDWASRYAAICSTSHDDIHSAISDIIDDVIGTRAEFVKTLQRDGFISFIARCFSPLASKRPTAKDGLEFVSSLMHSNDYEYIAPIVRIAKIPQVSPERISAFITEIQKYFDAKYDWVKNPPNYIIRAARNYSAIVESEHIYTSFIARCARNKITANYDLAALSCLFLSINLYSTCYNLRRQITKKESRIILISMCFLAANGYRFT